MTTRIEGSHWTTHPSESASTASEQLENVETLPPATQNVSGTDLMILRTLLLKMSDASIATGRTRIQRNDVLISKAIEEAAAARLRAADARSEEGGFIDGIVEAAKALTVDLARLEHLSDPFAAVEASLERVGDATIDSRQFWADLEKGALEIAKWGAVAGSVVLAIGSFGAAAPVAALAIVGAVMTCAAAADSTFHILEKCGVDKETAKWIDVGLCVGGALCSGASGVAQMLSSNTRVLPVAARAGALAVEGTAGAATGTGAAAHIQLGAFAREAKLADADAADAEVMQRRLERRIEMVMDAIREAHESCVRGIGRVGDAINNEVAGASALIVRA